MSQYDELLARQRAFVHNWLFTSTDRRTSGMPWGSAYIEDCAIMLTAAIRLLESQLEAERKGHKNTTETFNEQLADERKAREEAERMITKRPDVETLTHGRNCAAWTDRYGYQINEDKCTCGLKWRIQTQTAETISYAWRERAEALEKELLELRNGKNNT